MSFRKTILAVLFCSLIFSCDTASNVEPLYKDYFIKTFGTDGDQIGVDLIANDDNTLTILGNTTLPTGEQKIYFLKISLNGKILTEKILGTSSTEVAKDIELLSDGYIILSNIQSPSARFTTKNDIKLTRVNWDGDEVASVVYNSLDDQFGNSVTVTSDDRFFVIGNTKDTDAELNSQLVDITDEEDALIIEFDALTMLPTNTTRIGSSSIGMGIKIFENENGTFTYGGYSDELKEGDSYNSNLIFRSFINQPDNVQTLIVGDNIANESMSAFIKITNNNFYGIGTEFTATGGSRIFITNVVNGNTMESKSPVKIFSTSFGTSRVEGVNGCLSARNGSLIVVANEYSAIDDKSGIRLFNLNPFDGLENWSVAVGSAGFDSKAAAVTTLQDGSIILLGTTNLINQNKIMIIKVNENGKFE
jgi:hypothetical protein